MTILQSPPPERLASPPGHGLRDPRHLLQRSGGRLRRLGAAEFQVGFFMNPTGLDQIKQVALGGERMPQKATFFYPKLPTGLVFHDLNSDL